MYQPLSSEVSIRRINEQRAFHFTEPINECESEKSKKEKIPITVAHINYCNDSRRIETLSQPFIQTRNGCGVKPLIELQYGSRNCQHMLRPKYTECSVNN